MRHTPLLHFASLVLLGTVLVGCGDDDLTVAVADDVAGQSMGLPATAEAPRSATPAPDAPAVAPADAQPGSEAIDDGGASAGEETLPGSALERAAAAARERRAAEAAASDGEVSDGAAPDGAAPDGAAPDGAASDVPGTAEIQDPVISIDAPLGDLTESVEQPALPPIDEPTPPPVADEGMTAEEAALAEERNLPDEGEWTPPPIEEPKLEDGIWTVTFDYLGSWDSGLQALPEDSPMAIEARREQQLLAEKSSPTPTGLPPEPDELPIAPPTEVGFPEIVRKMDGGIVRIEGYMIPLKFDDGKVTSFFLSRYMMGCCFGMLPKANEIIEVEMAEGKGAFYDAYMPFIVQGKFTIVEEGTDPEYMQSVFRMAAESCDFSEDW